MDKLLDNASDGTALSELYVDKAIELLSIGNDGSLVHRLLYKAWQSMQDNPSQLKNIKSPAKYGLGLMTFLSYGTVTDIDYVQQIASVSYLFISKDLKQDISDVNLLKNRIVLMLLYHEAFEYTVSSAVRKGDDIVLYGLNPFVARDALYKMEYADLSESPVLLSVPLLNNAFQDLHHKVMSNFFGKGETTDSIIAMGNQNHEKVFQYLEHKVIADEDVKF